VAKRRAVNLKNFFAELKRRNVYKVAIAYGVVAWLLMQVASQIFPFFEIPNWAVRLVVLLLVIGFPIALVIAWAFELTPEGLKRTEFADELRKKSSRSRAWIYVVLIGGAISIALFFLGRYTASRYSQTAASAEKSIAVLPFENLSEEKSNAYFAEGIQDEILARLSKIADLKVISRTSTQKYKSAPANLREIAQQLGVGNVLEGSVQKAADKVRVTVQLINALNDSHLWAETYDRKLVDLFEVESEVAQKIAGSLEAKLTGREKIDIAAAGGTKIPQAYDAYLHARAFLNKQGTEDLEKAVSFGRRATEVDPNFAEAWALLAGAESQKYFFPDHSPEQLARARTAAETALRLAPDLAEAHAAMGEFYYYCLRDYDRALAELSVARQRAPNNSNALLDIALVQRRQGKFDASIDLLQKVSTLDPLNEDVWVNLGRSYRGNRNFDQARRMFDRALAIAPDDTEIISQKAETYLAQGDLETAWQMMKDVKFPPVSRGFGAYLNMLFYQRRYDDAFALVSSVLEKEKNLPPLFIAFSHLSFGNYFRMKGDEAKARSYFVEAKKELEQIRAAGDSGLLAAGALLQAEARLGHRDAVEQLATEKLKAVQNDKWQFPREEEEAARAYTILGDFNRALPLLEHVLTTPCVESLTPAYLRIDPEWDPVRNDPRFQKLANAQP
jgi:TolB-like protein/Tfp pilus assembly protein PilF